MSRKRSRSASLVIGLLYVVLVVSYFLFLVISLLAGGFFGMAFWVLVGTGVWKWLEGRIQDLDEKLR